MSVQVKEGEIHPFTWIIMPRRSSLASLLNDVVPLEALDGP